MKGYFSQLARRTGLRFTNAARTTSPALRAQHHAPPSPLHVEEVTLVSPTVTAPASEKSNVVKEESAQTTQITPTTHTADLPTPFSEASSPNIKLTALHHEPRESTATPIQSQNVRLLSPEHQFPVPERNVERDHIFERPVDEVKLERVEAKLVPPTPEITSAVTSLPQEAQTKAEAPAQVDNDLDPSNPIEREVLVRQYLREVRAWVAAPLTHISDDPEPPLTQEDQLTSEWQPENITVERRPFQTTAPPPQRDPIDVHETSLSIGSISVVIEDPKPNVTTIAPTQTTPSAPSPQPQPEPTNLSRYYLQRW